MTNKTELLKDFTYVENVIFKPWMKRGSRVTTMHGEGNITYVREYGGYVLNINVKITNGLQYQIHQCSAWAVKQLI